MNIAILSGKGGTGKTTVSTNLAMILGVSYVDLDVEEPNGFIFLNPSIQKSEDIFVEYPVINQNECKLCGACARACQFHALAKAGREIVVFEKLCHDCGACQIVCKTKALSYRKRSVGKLESGTSKNSSCMRGILNVGEPMAIPVIRNVLEELPSEDHLLDCSPGIGCSVIASISDTDIALIVTEPTRSGLDDLKRILELAGHFETQVMICVNKYDINLDMTTLIENYVKEKNLFVVGKIPFDNLVMESVNTKRPITEFEDSPARIAIEQMWVRINSLKKK